MARIYIVEDDEAIRGELITLLNREGYEVAWCESFDNAAAEALASASDLVLLDLSLPQTDGQLICREIRQSSEVPIIVLTSRTTEVDEVMSMTLGADDFIAKPYSSRVLLAHISAALRRSGAALAKATVEYKGVRLNLSRSEVSFNGATVELTKNELKILSLLMKRAGAIVSREELMRDLWDSDVFIDDNTLTVNVNRLRNTLTKIGLQGFLTTHRGMGYSV
ncbi:response regulator transcription factor [Olsenella sp. Marseille-QA0557]|uniref:response regulator transcription factor n=1 Tax=Olsenella sp. Marseille-QA0557 TaxID=3378782 RepID=UPI003D11032A